MFSKQSLITIAVLLIICVLQQFSIHSKKRELDECEIQNSITIEKLKTQISIVSYDVQVINSRRNLRDSLQEINIRHQQDEKIRLLDNASDTTIARLTRMLIAE
jgi:hypothetical protein